MVNNKLFEKLGAFSPERWDDDRQNTVCSEDEVDIIETQRDEMLEALIDLIVCDEEGFTNGASAYIDIIENATGKTWAEIKAIMEVEV